MKVIAFYLPQFHAIKENDEWWGKGFTEWVNVKKSKPLFKGHNQPEIPIYGNYYNLLDADTQIQQAKLAKEYGIGGFCYYHYWFNGKLLLEKPMEKMLHNDEVDIPFCISWANESWARTWDGEETNILIEQNYTDDVEGWKRHFEYLLPFLMSPKYIRHEGKPMIILYKPHLITNYKDMIECWRKLAEDAGLDGLYLGFQFPKAFDEIEENIFDFGIEFEPIYTLHELGNKEDNTVVEKVTLYNKVKRNLIRIYNKVTRKPIMIDYDDTWKQILNREKGNGCIFPGAFTSWDNTPRKGVKGLVFKGASPKKFREYFGKQVARAQEEYKSEYIFVNAWNEWAEGAHLEPDEKNQYGYLEAVKDTIA